MLNRNEHTEAAADTPLVITFVTSQIRKFSVTRDLYFLCVSVWSEVQSDKSSYVSRVNPVNTKIDVIYQWLLVVWEAEKLP